MYSVGQEHSDFQGPILNQLFIIPIALTLLLSLHKPFRDWFFTKVKILSTTIHGRMSALTAWDRDVTRQLSAIAAVTRRADFKVIIIASLIFVYANDAFRTLAYTIYTGHSLSDIPYHQDFDWLSFTAHLTFVYEAGWSYLGWVAFQLGRGLEFRRAMSPVPIDRFVAFSIFAFAVTLLVQSLDPTTLYRFRTHLSDYFTDSALWFACGIVGGIASGAYLFAKNIVQPLKPLLLAIFGYALLLYILNFCIFLLEQSALSVAGTSKLQILINHLRSLIWNICGVTLFIAFAASLAPGTFGQKKPKPNKVR